MDITFAGYYVLRACSTETSHVRISPPSEIFPEGKLNEGYTQHWY